MSKIETEIDQECNETLIRMSGGGVFLNADGVSQSPYLGPMYGDDLGRGLLGVSFASAERLSPSA